MQPVPAPASPRWLVTTGRHAPQTVERLLRSLPDWFGVESSIVDYIASAARLPTYLAWPAGDQDGLRAEHDAVGVLLAARHFPAAAEIYLMAVDKAVHRRGVGRAMVEALERDLARDHVRLLQVKTLGPSDPDAGYRRTRLFYQAMGFEPLEEITGLWPGNPSLIMVKTIALLAGRALAAAVRDHGELPVGGPQHADAGAEGPAQQIVAKDGGRCAGGGDPPAVEQYEPVSELPSQRQVVDRRDDGERALLAQLIDQLERVDPAAEV